MLHLIQEQILNTLFTANDLGDPRIMGLRTGEERVVGELCQLLGHRVGHRGCLAQAGVRGGIIQQTRLTKGLTVSLIGVCMKVGGARFSDNYCDRSSIFPQLARRSATQVFDEPGQFLRQCICSSLYFLIIMSFSKNSNFECP